MAVGEIHLDDVGTVFEVTIKDQNKAVVDISAATVKHITFLKAGGTKVEKDAVFTTDGKDGKMRYTAVATDINVVGDWKFQGFVDLPSGEWYSDIYSFRVHPNL